MCSTGGIAISHFSAVELDAAQDSSLFFNYFKEEPQEHHLKTFLDASIARKLHFRWSE